MLQPDLTYNDVFGNLSDYRSCVPGIGSISLDPLFDSTYELLQGSPCRDAGELLEIDPDGSRRNMGAMLDQPAGYPRAYDLNFGPDGTGGKVLTLNPQIYWSFTDSLGGNPEGYEVQTGDAPFWLGPPLWTTGPQVQPDTSVVFAGPALVDFARYYLRIRVFDGLVWGPWSARTFVTHEGQLMRVPENLATIQSAIDLTLDGDTVLVAPGTYEEHVDFRGRAITLLGKAGRDSTFIHAVRHEQPIVTFTTGEDTLSVLEGVTVRYAYDAEGIYCLGSSPIIRNCDVSFVQELGRRGIAILSANSAPQIRHNRIHDNSADGNYGAILASGTASRNGVALTIEGNDIYNNWAPGGGGIVSTSGDMIIIRDNLIRGNLSTDDAVVRVTGPVLIHDNTIVDNAVGIDAQHAAADIRNNIVADNILASMYVGAATVDYNDIWNNGTADGMGPNGLSSDPMFMNPATGDYTLQPLSPCIDAGDPDPMFNDPDSSRSDMGAAEASGEPHVPFGSCPLPLTGDVNNTGTITSADIIALVGYVFKGSFTPQPCEAVADCDCSGFITTADIIRLVNFVLGTPPAAAVVKGGDPPCNVCPLIIKGTWTCP